MSSFLVFTHLSRLSLSSPPPHTHAAEAPYHLFFFCEQQEKRVIFQTGRRVWRLFTMHPGPFWKRERKKEYRSSRLRRPWWWEVRRGRPAPPTQNNKKKEQNSHSRVLHRHQMEFNNKWKARRVYCWVSFLYFVFFFSTSLLLLLESRRREKEEKKKKNWPYIYKVLNPMLRLFFFHFQDLEKQLNNGPSVHIVSKFISWENIPGGTVLMWRIPTFVTPSCGDGTRNYRLEFKATRRRRRRK